MKSELVGYVRKSNSGSALKLSILKSAFDKAKTVEGRDGTEYVSLIINLSKIKMILGDEHEVTSVCQLVDDDINPEPAEGSPSFCVLCGDKVDGKFTIINKDKKLLPLCKNCGMVQVE